MSEYRIVGFDTDLNGNQAQLVTADPIVQRGDEFFIAEAPSWTEESLRQIGHDDLRFAVQIPPAEQVLIHPGEIVWLVGRTVIAELRRTSRAATSSLTQFQREVGRWNRTERMGFAWTTGSRAQLNELISEPITDVTALLKAALFDKQELSHGDADAYFAIFRALVQHNDYEHLMTRALYYRERYDEQRLHSVARRATRAKFAPTNDVFLQSVEQRVIALSASRLSQLRGATPVPVSGQKNLLGLLSSLIAVGTDYTISVPSNLGRASAIHIPKLTGFTYPDVARLGYVANADREGGV